MCKRKDEVFIKTHQIALFSLLSYLPKQQHTDGMYCLLLCLAEKRQICIVTRRKYLHTENISIVTSMERMH